MLKDIGPLQIGEQYAGKEVLGKNIEIQSDGLGTLLGSGVILMAFFDSYLFNGGIGYQIGMIIIGIILLLFGNEKREVEVTKYGKSNIKRIKFFFNDGKNRRYDFDKEFKTEYSNMIGAHHVKAIILGKRDDSNMKYWLYQDKVWKENEDYSSKEVKLLVDAKLEKKKIRLERAEKIKERRKNPEIKEEDGRSRRISQDVKDRVWNRDNGKCVECGSNENLEFDHIIPFSKGGANTYRNIQLLCEHCNRSKSANIG